MSDYPKIPILYFAFANHKAANLRALDKERDGIKKALRPLQVNRKVQVIDENNITTEKIFSTFRDFKNRINLFHFGGHASLSTLVVANQENPNQSQSIDLKALVDFLIRKNSEGSIVLIFLNGCSTYQFVTKMLLGGIDAVVATSYEIPDELAAAFSIEFYKNLVADLDIPNAYKDAAAYINTEYKCRGKGDKRFLGKILRVGKSDGAIHLYENETDEKISFRMDDMVKVEGSETRNDFYWGLYLKNEFGAVKNKTLPYFLKPYSYKEEDDYFMLCDINFKHEVNYFETLLEINYNSNVEQEPSLACRAFIISARQNYGQRWLYNLLINRYKRCRKKVIVRIIDFHQKRFETLMEWVDYLIKQITGCYIHGTLRSKRKQLRTQIQKKIKTGSIFLILKNAYEFIQFVGIHEFNDFLEYIFGELSDTKEHKCILFFIENYRICYDANYCLFSKKIAVSEVRLLEKFKLIDLDEIQPIEESSLSKWVNGKINRETLQLYRENESKIKNIIRTNNGNPEKIIPAICEPLNIKYSAIKKWIKY